MSLRDRSGKGGRNEESRSLLKRTEKDREHQNNLSLGACFAPLGLPGGRFACTSGRRLLSAGGDRTLERQPIDRQRLAFAKTRYFSKFGGQSGVNASRRCACAASRNPFEPVTCGCLASHNVEINNIVGVQSAVNRHLVLRLR
jgi:hypothetical protein